MTKQERIELLFNKRAWLIKGDTKAIPVSDGEASWQDRLKENSKNLSKLLVNEENIPDLPDYWQPDFPDHKEVLKLETFQELKIHYMGLPGWAYRNIDENLDMVKQQIYEVAKRTRIAGAEYLRTFIMNGSRKVKEKYVMDAIPWEMINKDGRKVIDFNLNNIKYWNVLEIIEQACMYWKIQHMPTFWMERYNDGIFTGINNVQNVHGFWTDETLPIKIKFMRDFMDMQKALRSEKYLSPFEFINEPLCWGNHTKGAVVADHHLALWRGVEDLTVIRKAMTCSGGCDFAHANFTGKHWFDGRYYGSDEFKDREIIADFHSASELQSLYDVGFIHGLGSAWKHLSFNEDGSNTGSYSPIPWTKFKLANAVELYDTLHHGHTECQKKNKKFFFTIFMLDCLRQDKLDNMIPKEEFDPKQILQMNWDRTLQYRKMREEL